jgi:hypothetical protein
MVSPTPPCLGAISFGLVNPVDTRRNGLTDPYHQFGSVPDWACEGDYAVYDPAGSECAALRGKVPRCQSLVSGCYR